MPAIVPDGIEFRIDLKEAGSEVKGLLGVVLAFLLGDRMYLSGGGRDPHGQSLLGRVPPQSTIGIPSGGLSPVPSGRPTPPLSISHV